MIAGEWVWRELVVQVFAFILCVFHLNGFRNALCCLAPKCPVVVVLPFAV